jgi:DNA polymerase III alpha subunit (gram-positive type)
MIGVLDVDTDEYTAYIGDDVPLGLMRLAEADLVIGHCFKTFDAVVIKKLTDGLIDIKPEKIFDTCEYSRALFPKLENHRLSTWGDIFQDHKLEYDKGFDKFHPEMIPYLEQDVKLNARLYRFLKEQVDSLDEPK